MNSNSKTAVKSESLLEPLSSSSGELSSPAPIRRAPDRKETRRRSPERRERGSDRGATRDRRTTQSKRKHLTPPKHSRRSHKRDKYKHRHGTPDRHRHRHSSSHSRSSLESPRSVKRPKQLPASPYQQISQESGSEHPPSPIDILPSPERSISPLLASPRHSPDAPLLVRSPSPPPQKLPAYYPAIYGCVTVDHYEILNRIEEGTFGVVYRAKDKRTGETVALKRLKMEKEKEGFPVTSLREINTLLKASHENVVHVRQIVVGHNMDKIYLVMDFLEHDLKSLMEVMRKPFLSGEVKTLMIQLLRGLAHLHDSWILHRDIKTSNLLLSHRGRLRIGDFGLAREYGSPLKAYTSLVVTLWYRAPELLLGADKYSTPIDLWSVGCVFAELVNKKALFTGKSEIDQISRIFQMLGTPNEGIWPGYSQLSCVKKASFTVYPFNNLRKSFPHLSDQGVKLMNSFLTYSPEFRITARDAEEHPYFKETPYPVPPDEFPTWPAKSEQSLSSRGRRDHWTEPSGGYLRDRRGRIQFEAILTLAAIHTSRIKETGELISLSLSQPINCLPSIIVINMNSMIVRVMILLSLPGLLAGLQSPLLNQLWRQGKLRLSHPEMASLHLELSRIDELEVRLRGADRYTAERLSLEVRDRFREVMDRYQLTAPLPGTLEGTPAWNEVELEDKWTQDLWSRVRELPFSDEQLDQLIYQLRIYDVLERELTLTPSEEKVFKIEELRDAILSQLSRDTHDLVRHISENIHTFKNSHKDTDYIKSGQLLLSINKMIYRHSFDPNWLYRARAATVSERNYNSQYILILYNIA
ncbi:Cyclin-dependent kinase 11B isoform X2 [Oopsacas minuta]|uniref:cyclin-dependent kinase n=1 Tax=Oopsacas minuta TaxID=111878 RepID=A0AAV7K6K3_9METZ|nr:Cyclin-dependent kinase 11B isoform X2 [Oopsacas minuta]